ncbi:hypothetical protein [Gracilimonas tropica]|uniref:hypothetical protein n=1 Tax=Gracilimonas tropica TaxID=454600 RepID=UPI00037DFF3B|nr:hypothetical protein [Gracilimonas tropica]
MATVYAKNPAELVIQNPAKSSKKKNSKTTKKMAKQKRKKNGRFTSKKRSNPAGDFVDTGKNLFMKFGLAALAATGVTKIISIGVSKTQLPKVAKDAVIIAGPAVGGIITSMVAGKNNAIAQGIAGGMVLASVNTATDRFMPKEGDLSDSDMIVKADGYVYDQNGNPIAQINMPGAEETKMLPESTTAFQVIPEHDNMLGEFEGSFESGESWAV